MIKSSIRPQPTAADQVDYYDYGQTLATQAIARIAGKSSVQCNTQAASVEAFRQLDEPSIADRLAGCFDFGRFINNVARHSSYPTD